MIFMLVHVVVTPHLEKLQHLRFVLSVIRKMMGRMILTQMKTGEAQTISALQMEDLTGLR